MTLAQPAFVPALQQTKNLIKLYTHMCGIGEVPRTYHVWSCLSLLSACVEDRVYIEKHKDERLTTSLYVFLIGPPALGKGSAISRAFRSFLAAGGGGHYWHGQATAQHLVDVLGKDGADPETGQTYIPSPKLWLIQDELATDIGSGQLAGDFVKWMTKLYTSCDLPVDTGTRTKGTVRIENPAVTWLAGTTEEWMHQSLGKDAAASGFTSRVCYVFAPYGIDRYVRTIYPPDYEEVKAHVLTRLWMLKHMKGEFYQSPEALAREHAWYMNRKRPKEEELLPNWKREQDLVLKLAMLLALADGDSQLVIEPYHIDRAIRLSASVQRNLPEVIKLSRKTEQIDQAESMERCMTACEGWTAHTKLLQRARGRGVAWDLGKRMLEAAMKDGSLEWKKSPSGALWYRWKATGASAEEGAPGK